MRIAITGATGMIGTALTRFLERNGHVPMPISRRPVPGGIVWDPVREAIDAAALEGVDAVIHLAGENIAGRRWTARRKAELRNSRVGPTAFLARTLASLDLKPLTLLSASAVGIYGDHGDAIVDEQTPSADDFLGGLARDWEAAAAPARDAGIRVVHPRFATVLAPHGGALEKMLPPFRLGLGGPLAGGKHWMPWVEIDDLLHALLFMIEHAAISGPVNVVAPGIVRNSEFTSDLAAALHRPAIIPVPRLALHALFGELAEAALLTSMRVVPAVLDAHRFTFVHPTLPEALAHVLAADA